MNKKLKVFSLAILILSLAGFILYYFIFNIYEIEVTVSPKMVFADPSCEIQIEIKPINAMGWKVPFRTATGKFKIVKGNNIVEIIKNHKYPIAFQYAPKLRLKLEKLGCLLEAQG